MKMSPDPSGDGRNGFSSLKLAQFEAGESISAIPNLRLENPFLPSPEVTEQVVTAQRVMDYQKATAGGLGGFLVV